MDASPLLQEFNLGSAAIIVLWIVVWGTYWFELYYYEGPDTIDYIYYWLGLLAWVPRPLAWARQRGSGLSDWAAPLLVVVGSLAALLAANWGPGLYGLYESVAYATGDPLLIEAILAELLVYLVPTLPLILTAFAITLVTRRPVTA